MSELADYITILKQAVHLELEEQDHTIHSPVLQFPYTSDYKDWMLDKLKTFPSHGRRWLDLYRDIIKMQFEPAGIKLPEEWKEQLITHPTNCLYIIADEDETILYIGKSEYPALTRIIDRMMPAYSEKHPNGQKMNNVPEVWNKYLLNEKRLKLFFCYDLGIDPEILEYYILFRYKKHNDQLPPYNKTMPKQMVLQKSYGIRGLVDQFEGEKLKEINQRILTEDENIIQNIEKALDLTLGDYYCPYCLNQPVNRYVIIDKYRPLILNQELKNDVTEIHNALLYDDFLIDKFSLMEGKNVTVEIYSECWVDEEGTEVPPPFKPKDIYEKYLSEFWKTGVNCKIGRCGCKVDIQSIYEKSRLSFQ